MQGQTPYPNQPYMQGQAPYPNQPVFYNMPYSAEQPQMMEPPKNKKSHKALFIVLGSIGGVLVVGIILVVILLNHFNKKPSNFPIASGSDSNHQRVESNDQEYYYPDYNKADHNSESFVSVIPTTEADSGSDTSDNTNSGMDAASTEEQTTEAEDGISAFSDDDLIIYSRINDIQIPIEADHSYQILNDELCTISSYNMNDLTEELNQTKGYGSFETGRGTVIGASADDYLATYGTDTSNALWIMLNGAYSTTYYFSSISKPSFEDEHTLLTIGWSIEGTSFHRLTPEELNDIIFNYDTTGSDIRYLIYYADIDTNYTIRSLSMVYGNPMVIPEMD